MGQLPKHPHIFALGDVVSTHAMRAYKNHGEHAQLVTKNLLSLIRGQPLDEGINLDSKGAFEYPPVISFGPSDGVAIVPWLDFTFGGFLGGLIHTSTTKRLPPAHGEPEAVMIIGNKPTESSNLPSQADTVTTGPQPPKSDSARRSSRGC